MNYPEILRVLQQEPLAILPSAHASWFSRFEAYLEFRSAKREDGMIFGEAIEREQATVVNGVMRLPVGGPVGRNLGPVEKACGCVDFAEIIADLDTSENDTNCRGCVIDWDCPGGMVQGGKEVAQRIIDCEKPVYSFSSGLMCSQAYYIACASKALFATEDAKVANIGVYCYALDRSKQYADMGLKPLLITSGKYKGMGAPGVPLTKDQIALLQDEVNVSAEKFYAHVDEMRGGAVSREDMQGQCFAGDVAAQRGLIDGVIDSWDDVAALL